MKESKDKFSAQSKQYQQFRPHYPDILFSFLYSTVQNFNTAWDCGTGNGQVASKLSERFNKVLATDISKNQLNEAVQKENVTYFLSRAEKTEFPDNSFDLITVAQALHWFDLENFYKEVKRVAKPNGVVAVWGYHLLRLSPEINRIIDEFYAETLGSYWDPERSIVDKEYKFIPFPFKEFEAPKFEIVANWDFQQALGYFNSWSAVQNYIKANEANPVDLLEKKLKPFWKDGEIKKVRFRVFVRIGTVEK